MAKNGGDAFTKRKQGGNAVKVAARQVAVSGAPKVRPSVNLSAAASPAGRAVRNRTGPARANTAGTAGTAGTMYQGAPYAAGGGAPAAFGGAGTLQTMVAQNTPRKWEDLSEQEQNDYLKGDATYVAQSGALEQELKNLIAELGLQRTNYNTDFNSALSNLGWDTKTNSFDPRNLLGAYGASYSNQENDFAGRGMLDSSAYAQALENLGTSFNKQKGDLETARGNFLRELETRETGAKNTHTQDLQRARADAIARRAAREGLI